MNLSKIDVVNKKFSRRFRGYSVQEVDHFMQEMGESLGELAEDNTVLEDEAVQLKKTPGRA